MLKWTFFWQRCWQWRCLQWWRRPRDAGEISTMPSTRTTTPLVPKQYCHHSFIYQFPEILLKCYQRSVTGSYNTTRSFQGDGTILSFIQYLMVLNLVLGTRTITRVPKWSVVNFIQFLLRGLLPDVVSRRSSRLLRQRRPPIHLLRLQVPVIFFVLTILQYLIAVTG